VRGEEVLGVEVADSRVRDETVSGVDEHREDEADLQAQALAGRRA